MSLDHGSRAFVAHAWMEATSTLLFLLAMLAGGRAHHGPEKGIVPINRGNQLPLLEGVVLDCNGVSHHYMER